MCVPNVECSAVRWRPVGGRRSEYMRDGDRGGRGCGQGSVVRFG